MGHVLVGRGEGSWCREEGVEAEKRSKKSGKGGAVVSEGNKVEG